jgi:hypothetical protein
MQIIRVFLLQLNIRFSSLDPGTVTFREDRNGNPGFETLKTGKAVIVDGNTVDILVAN